MKNFIYILTALLLLSGCSKDEAKEQEETQDNRPELFGYKFGSTIEEVDPDEIITPDSCFKYGGSSNNDCPARIFLFKDNKLISICDYYYTDSDYQPSVESITQSINIFSPPAEVELVIASVQGSSKTFWKFPDTQNGLTWQYEKINITIYNAITYWPRAEHCVIIKYTRNDSGHI